MTPTTHSKPAHSAAPEPKPPPEKVSAPPSAGPPSGTAPVIPADPNTQGRLAAIIRGETVPTETHPAVAKEEAVLSVQDFNLWYGPKQALFNIQIRVPK